MKDFLGDFREEATEHLQNINQNLLALEQTLSENVPLVDIMMSRLGLINDLFRSFHTLKGLSGMVGLSQAEELSHLMESVLRGIQVTEIDINSHVLDLLFEGTHYLEVIVATLSDPNLSVPDTSSTSTALNKLLHSTRSSTHRLEENQTQPPVEAGDVQRATHSYRPGYPDSFDADAESSTAFSNAVELMAEYPQLTVHLETVDYYQIETAMRTGKALDLLLFVPSLEKTEQGHNISNLREQISKVGELIKAMPLVEDNQVKFVLITASPKPIEPQEFSQAEIIPLFPKDKTSLDMLSDKATPASEDTPGSTRGETQGKAFPAKDGSPMPSVIRVGMDRLDQLMFLSSELTVNRTRLSDLVNILSPSTPLSNSSIDEIKHVVGKLERNLRDLRQAVVSTRMVPLYEVFGHMPLAVRDLARSLGKDILLVMEGEHTEIDKMIVERLLNPLLHLVRNAVTHGIEAPEERQAAGKPVQGLMKLRGSFEGDQVLVQVIDDGRGINREGVIEKARRLGLVAAGNKDLDDTEILDLICKPGFSTLDEAGLSAGRGVGMEVVARLVKSVGGVLEMKTNDGLGTTFTMRLPVTLSLVEAILVLCGSEKFAIPQHMVEEAIEIDPGEIIKLESGELIPFRETALALVRLSRLFHIPPSLPRRYLYGVIVYDNEQRSALVVDRLLGLREVVVRSINDPLISQPGIFGATDLGDGKVTFILDVPALLRMVL